MTSVISQIIYIIYGITRVIVKVQYHRTKAAFGGAAPQIDNFVLSHVHRLCYISHPVVRLSIVVQSS